MVVVHAQEVDGRADDREVVALDQFGKAVVAHVVQEVLGVARQQHGFEVHAIEEGVHAARGLDVNRVLGRMWVRVGQVQRDAQLA